MNKKLKYISYSIFLSIIFNIFLIFIAQMISGFIEAQTPHLGTQIGDTPPAWWASGFPVPMMFYDDCPSGCIPELNLLGILFDVIFWEVIIFKIFFKKKLDLKTELKYST